jgi:mRNA interferase HigB
MRVIAVKALREYWTRYADAEGPLKAWFASTERAIWNTPHDIKAEYAAASILSTDRVVFNIKGNHYRLIVAVAYDAKIVFVKWFGTHAEYDRINALTVGLPQTKPKAAERMEKNGEEK